MRQVLTWVSLGVLVWLGPLGLPLLPSSAAAQTAAGNTTEGTARLGSVEALPGAQEAVEAPDLPAFLIADSVTLAGESQLIAEGNVEVLHDGVTLRAERIIYDDAAQQLAFDGPIRIEQADGTIITAQSGQIDAGFREGLLKSARLVLDQQLQMAAVQLARTEGRYTALSKAAVTSCQVCSDTGRPLWEIRARRIIHDDEEKQIYLDGAHLRVLDVPILYVPRLRFPDPSLNRARGFLFPTFRSTSKLGIGVKVPYFIPIGDHKDITLTPYLSPKTTTLEARYRQAFRTGRIQINGALTQDALRSGETRGYLFGEGSFDLPRDYTLSFDVELSSDEAYLKDYGYSSKGRLDSAIGISKVTRNRLTLAKLTHYNTLLDDESSATQPSHVLDFSHQQRHHSRFGGELRFGADLHGHYRTSEDDVVGRDVYRLHANAHWHRSGVTDWGLETTAQFGVDLDTLQNQGDSTVDSQSTSVSPNAMIRLRMPFVGQDSGGSRYVLEPVVQLSMTGGGKLTTANDESQRSELDDGNLLALSRFAAADRRERGWAMGAGVRWAMDTPSGWSTGLTIGRVIRQESRPDFSVSSGLAQAQSDWLLSTTLSNTDGMDLMARLLTDAGKINRAEARGVWSNSRIKLGASYLFLPEDRQESRNELVSEWALDTSLRIARHWTASTKWKYDIAKDRTASGKLGLEYQNECVIARFEADRDFSDSDNLDPTTSYELTIALTGFSTGGAAGGYRRTCSN